MIFSDANRRQLFAVDMAYALVIIYNDLVKTTDQEVLNIITATHENIKIIQNKIYGGGALALKYKDLKKHDNTIVKLQKAIDSVLGRESRLSLDFIAGVLAIVSNQYDQLKTKSKLDWYIGVWGTLMECLQSLYEYYDQNIEQESCMDNGVKIEQEFLNIMKTI